MIQNPTAERPTPDCCFCDNSIFDKPSTTYGDCPIHVECLEVMHSEMDQHREEDEPPADYEPTDDDWDACLQSYYGYGSQAG
jgi:hypothetical protein